MNCLKTSKRAVKEETPVFLNLISDLPRSERSHPAEDEAFFEYGRFSKKNGPKPMLRTKIRVRGGSCQSCSRISNKRLSNLTRKSFGRDTTMVIIPIAI